MLRLAALAVLAAATLLTAVLAVFPASGSAQWLTVQPVIAQVVAFPFPFSLGGSGGRPGRTGAGLDHPDSASGNLPDDRPRRPEARRVLGAAAGGHPDLTLGAVGLEPVSDPALPLIRGVHRPPPVPGLMDAWRHELEVSAALVVCPKPGDAPAAPHPGAGAGVGQHRGTIAAADLRAVRALIRLD